MLRSVVTEGTATMAEVPGYPVAGKTGTADSSSPTVDTTKTSHNKFCRIVSCEQPQICISCNMNEPEDNTGEEVRYGWMDGCTSSGRNNDENSSVTGIEVTK